MPSPPLPDEPPPQPAEEGEGVRYWIVCKCPLEGDCSEQAWKRAQIWSKWCPDHVRDKLKKHLMTSGKHNLSEEDANVFSDAADVDTYVDNDKTKNRVKRERPDSPASDAAEIAPTKRRRGSASLGAVCKASAPPSAQTTLAAREITIPVRASALASLSDSVRRAQHAAKQSKRLSEAGAACFGREEQVFGDVLKHIDDVVDEATFLNSGIMSTATPSSSRRR